MLNNKNLKLISIIKKYINNDPKLYVKFNHYNRKYPIDELIVGKKLKFFRRTIYYRNIRRWYII